MTKSIAAEIAALHGAGWRPFQGCVATTVYDTLPCGQANSVDTLRLPGCTPQETAQRPKKFKKPEPFWFYCGDTYMCLGCHRRCCLTRPAGFQCELELRYNTKREKYTLTPAEMVRKLNQLTPEQAAYCLNISRNQVYHWIREGKLPRSKTEMFRIPVAAVRALLEERED